VSRRGPDEVVFQGMQQLTTKHARGWQLHRGKVGDGHVAQRLAGRFTEGLVQARGPAANRGRVGGDWAVAWPAASVTEASRASAERRNHGDGNQRGAHPTGRERGSRTNDFPNADPGAFFLRRRNSRSGPLPPFVAAGRGTR